MLCTAGGVTPDSLRCNRGQRLDLGAAFGAGLFALGNFGLFVASADDRPLRALERGSRKVLLIDFLPAAHKAWPVLLLLKSPVSAKSRNRKKNRGKSA